MEEDEFISADDEDDFFDLPQDLGLESTGRPTLQRSSDVLSGIGDLSGSEASDDDADAKPVYPPGFKGGYPANASGTNPPGFRESHGENLSSQWNLRNDGDASMLEPVMEKLKLTRDNVKLSKGLSYLLRHAAHKLDVDIRKDGFVRVKNIMNLKQFRPYNLEELMAVVFFDEKERYTMVREYDGELLVRANQGHTLKIVDDVMLLTKIEDPDEVTEVVHGSYLVHWPFIRTQGLSKVARNHIHLANGVPEDGKIRGMRSSAELFVYVDIKAAMESGIVFFRSKNDVILTQGVDGWLPSKFFVRAVKIDYAQLVEEEMDYEVNDRPPWPAELAPTGPGLGGTYAVKNLESLIMKCKQRFQELKSEQGLDTVEDQRAEDEMERLHLELLSLEQRLRQHKGIGRLTKTEKQDRAKDNLEMETVIERKDRAATPPWAKKQEAIEPKHGISQKEKEEWAALGRIREDGKDAPPREDKWASLRKDTPQSSSTLLTRESKEEEKWNLVTSKKNKDRDSVKQESRRDTGTLSSQSGNVPASSNVPATHGGPPRLFSSKPAIAAGSWRDRLKEKSKDFPHTNAAIRVSLKHGKSWGAPISDDEGEEGDIESDASRQRQDRREGAEDVRQRPQQASAWRRPDSPSPSPLTFAPPPSVAPEPAGAVEGAELPAEEAEVPAEAGSAAALTPPASTQPEADLPEAEQRLHGEIEGPPSQPETPPWRRAANALQEPTSDGGAATSAGSKSQRADPAPKQQEKPSKHQSPPQQVQKSGPQQNSWRKGPDGSADSLPQQELSWRSSPTDQQKQQQQNQGTGRQQRSVGKPYQGKIPQRPAQQQGPGAPQQGQMMPHQAQMMPQQGMMIPQQGQMMPQQAQMMPQQGQMMPHQAQMVPLQGQMIPQQGQMMPQQAQMMPQQGQMGFMPGQQQMGFMPGQQQMSFGQPVIMVPQQQMQMMQMFQQQQMYMMQQQMQLQQNGGWQHGQQAGQQEGDNSEQGVQGGQSTQDGANPSFGPGSQGQGEMFGGDDRRLRGVPMRQSGGPADSGFLPPQQQQQQQMFVVMNQDPRQQQYGFQGTHIQQQFSKPNTKGMPFQQGPTIDTGQGGRGNMNSGKGGSSAPKGGKFQQRGSFDSQENATTAQASNKLIMNIPQHPMGTSTNGQQFPSAPLMDGQFGGKGWKDKGISKDFQQDGGKSKGKGTFGSGFVYNNSKGVKGNKKGQFVDFQGGKGRGKLGKGRGSGGAMDRKVDDDAWAAIGRLRQDHADGNGISGSPEAGGPEAGGRADPGGNLDAGIDIPDVSGVSPDANGGDADAN